MLSLREYKENYHLFTSICLNVTNDCNLKCRYCFVEQHPTYMTLDTAKAAVDFLHNNLKRKREITKNPNLRGSISFFGGEPMLCYSSIIVPLVQYIEETYPNDFSLGITTNGTLLNKKRIDFFKKHNINILLSIDGNKETQDYNRPCKNCNQSSFDLIEKNISYLLKNFPNTTFRMTVYEDTCDKLFDNILYAIEKGFKNIYFCPDSRHNFSEENCQKLRIELEKIFLYFTGCLLNNLEYPNIAPIDSGLKLALQKSIRDLSIEEKCLPREIFRCGLGTTAASIGPTGDIYACQEQTSQDSESNPFYIGNIYDGIDNEKHEKLLAEFRTLSPIICEDANYCDDCSLLTTCYDVGCPSASKARFDNFFIRAKMSCYWDRMIAELAQGILSIENENIEKYLKRLLRIKEADCNGC